MQRAGFFRVLQPKRWGGYEMDLHTFYEVELALARRRHVDRVDLWRLAACIPGSWRCWTIAPHRRCWGSDTAALICSSLMPAGKAIPVPRRAFASAAAGDMRAAATIATGRCLARWLASG